MAKSPIYQLIEYTRDFRRLGGKVDNVLSFTAHWLYGTDVETLCYLSHKGIVYNPPGF